jgi:ketosteroid isomerase-like protein
MQPKELVKEFYARYQRRDLDKALDLCTEDIDFLWTADSRHARFSGPALGKAAFRGQLEALDKRFVYQAYTPLEVIAEGDKVAVRAVIRMTQRDGGREFLMQVADFWTVRDGKLAALVEYYDTALAAQVT